jgi:surface carbohydrate biosynthesis protein
VNNSASTIIIPVETQVRELDAKLLLACVAAERGFPVILGSRAFVHFKVSALPRGVYLAKSMRKLSIRMFEILRQLGHEIVAWDEEGLMRWPDAEYYRQRLSPITMGQISHLVAWGPDNARVFQDYPGYRGTPIYTTGNPRIDLLRGELRDYYQPEVEKIHRRYGEFVLINTNFGLVNHYYPKLGALKQAMEAEDSGGAHTYDVAKGRHKLALFNGFLEMLPPLCEALGDTTIVLRPHPSENHGPYAAIAERYPNLKIANDGGISPWLMAAKALVANGCTTMIESAVLGTPTISYQPVVSEVYDDDLPNSLSHRTFATDELCRKVASIVSGEQGALEDGLRRKILDRHITALDGALAAERMVDVLEAGAYHQRRPDATPLAKYARGWIHNTLRTAVKQVNMRRPGHRNNLAFHAHRFPDITVDEIMERIQRMGTLLKRFGSIRVEPYSKHIFSIKG